MKQLFILTLILLSAVVHGQTTIADSTIKVIYANEITNEKKPAVFINGRFVGHSLSIQPDDINSITIMKEVVEFDSVKYYGKIYITTKDNFSPKLISLTALKEKYTVFANKPVIFTIDGTIINSDYDKYLVDENYLLQIIVDKIFIAKANIDLGLIKLLTKSQENIRKSKEIRIRGTETTLN